MKIELCEVKGDQQERFFSAVRALALRRCDFRFHIAPGFVEGFGKHSHILVRPLDTVKWRFGLITHRHAFPTSLLPRVALVN